MLLRTAQSFDTECLRQLRLSIVQAKDIKWTTVKRPLGQCSHHLLWRNGVTLLLSTADFGRRLLFVVHWKKLWTENVPNLVDMLVGNLRIHQTFEDTVMSRVGVTVFEV